jgi:flagellar basal-body rod protein FlgB
MISDLVTSNQIDLLERTVSFTEQRHKLILENLANVDTPGYVQKDVSVQDFQKSLSDAIEKTRQSFSASLDPEDTDTVQFGGSGNLVSLRPQGVVKATPFHDRGVRSMENLMAQLADNAQAHNMAAAMLKGRYDTVQRAISLKA